MVIMLHEMDYTTDLAISWW